ncbi:MAG: PIG-L family deacetylase [Gemmataceae bacterium]|nr:PIG-L family deacetylase [Gemmataceae bacterium]
MPPTALAVLAHPDDAEFLCAGTLARLGNEHGWSIHLASMTAGDCGSAEYGPDELSRLRRAEGAAAAAAVGGHYHCVGELDLRVVYDARTVEQVTRLLNKVRPQVVFTHSPDDYHMDHEQTSKVVRGAMFAAPIPNFLHNRPGAAEKDPPLDKIPHLYYCDPVEGKDAFGNPIPAGFRVDIGGVIDLKAKMLGAHETQKAWLRHHHGVDELVDSMRAWAATQGKAAGVRYAEGFRQHLGHSYPQNNILAELLGKV